MKKVLSFAIFCIFLTGCANPQQQAAQRAAQMAQIQSMSDLNLCENVSIRDWPPTWRGGKGLFWYALEADYRTELQTRGVTPFLCSDASKRCVSYGFSFGSPEHRDCTVTEGGNIAASQRDRNRRKRDEQNAIFGSSGQNNSGGLDYDTYVKPYLRDTNNTFCHSGGTWCTD